MSYQRARDLAIHRYTVATDVDDVLQYVADTREANPGLEDLPRFLIVRDMRGLACLANLCARESDINLCGAKLQGHSMGGAIAYLTSRRSEDVWTGVVFSGPGTSQALAV